MLYDLNIDGFWEVFDDLPAEMAQCGLQENLEYLRVLMENATDPLM
jgi:hypothetical protein